VKVAIVGTGIAGLTVARVLHARHEITVLEASAHVGGHAHTHRMERWGRTWDVDTGFMVYNDVTYPHFRRLLAELGVATRATSMSFGVSDPATGLEYRGDDFDGLFARRSNLFRPSFVRMVFDVLRFNREALALTATGTVDPALTLGELVSRGGYGPALRDHYLVPMAGAIWSASAGDVLAMPAGFFLRFFHNHGLLRPPHRQLQWRTVVGGARRYVEVLVRPFASRIRTLTPVRVVRRVADGVEVATDAGVELFDEVVLAVHAPQALALLADATALERQVLGAFRTRSNEAVLHVDASCLPARRAARASWNVRVPRTPSDPVGVTYDVSRLQGLTTPEPVLVTLNAGERIDEARVIARMTVDHPVMDARAVAAQRRHDEVSGSHRVHFCGAYWRNGFHEDGVASGIAVARALGCEAGWT